MDVPRLCFDTEWLDPNTGVLWRYAGLEPGRLDAEPQSLLLLAATSCFTT